MRILYKNIIRVNLRKNTHSGNGMMSLSKGGFQKGGPPLGSLMQESSMKAERFPGASSNSPALD